MCTLYSCVVNASLLDILERQQQQAAVEKKIKYIGKENTC